ncbi:hypothetical protein Q5P01_017259 [Channa striata]|uniref:Uncharacterized protein n=1 Tax=Channa striata TaxID=64152 RepID=A0AA88M978_CHASR|nr:hypothetical protein Q5P01_017259 [Channa striata]
MNLETPSPPPGVWLYFAPVSVTHSESLTRISSEEQTDAQDPQQPRTLSRGATRPQRGHGQGAPGAADHAYKWTDRSRRTNVGVLPDAALGDLDRRRSGSR